MTYWTSLWQFVVVFGFAYGTLISVAAFRHSMEEVAATNDKGYLIGGILFLALSACLLFNAGWWGWHWFLSIWMDA